MQIQSLMGGLVAVKGGRVRGGLVTMTVPMVRVGLELVGGGRVIGGRVPV